MVNGVVVSRPEDCQFRKFVENDGKSVKHPDRKKDCWWMLRKGWMDELDTKLYETYENCQSIVPTWWKAIPLYRSVILPNRHISKGPLIKR